MTTTESTFEELFRSAQHTAWHSEARDAYALDEAYQEWIAGNHFDPAKRWPWWIDLVSASVARGVEVRRARVVSEPVSAYIRYEHALTGGHNVKAGESVRWLPRRQASSPRRHPATRSPAVGTATTRSREYRGLSILTGRSRTPRPVHRAGRAAVPPQGRPSGPLGGFSGSHGAGSGRTRR
ncbi:DUF6879 family protein [Streptomyces sp. C10]|uniref:DUF6879 family protein n=1 Tax=Streptomyces sp. C10 TaxID=531941 RepID=UPI00397FFC9E